MGSKTVKIGDCLITLSATFLALIEFRRMAGKDWYAARGEQLKATMKALKFQEEYAGLTDEKFAALPQDKQDAYWHGLSGIQVDMDFTLNTIYAMARAGGYRGAENEFLNLISPKDLAPDSELMAAVAELVDEFTPEVKKNITQKAT